MPEAAYTSVPAESMVYTPTRPGESSVRRRASLFGQLTKAKTVRNMEKEAAMNARQALKHHESEAMPSVIPSDDWERWVGKVDVVFPDEPWKLKWDFLLMVAIVYSCVTVPFRLGMAYPAEGNWWLFEVSITGFFIADLWLTFRVAAANGPNELLVERTLISKRYWEFWLWVDASSSFPVELVEVIFNLIGRDGNDSNLRLLKLLRALRLLRLLRLLKVLKLNAIMQVVEMRLAFPIQYLQLTKMLAGILYLMHIFGCGWYYLHLMEVETASTEGREPTTWLTEYMDGSRMDASKWEHYLSCIYWALMTLTTVGYGDIVPYSNSEQLYLLLVLLVGAIVFGFLISSLGDLLSNVDPTRVRIDAKVDEIKQYLRWHGVPIDLALAVQRYYEYYFSRRSIANEEELLGNLTPSLKRAVLTHLLAKTVARIPLFASHNLSYVTLDFQLLAHSMLKPLVREAKEVIIEKHARDTAVYFLSRGNITAAGDMGNPFFQLDSQGSCFGEQSAMHELSSFTYAAVIRSEIFSVSVRDLEKLALSLTPDGRDELAEGILEAFIKHSVSRNVALRFYRISIGATHHRRADVAALRLQHAYHSRMLHHLTKDAGPQLEDLMPTLYGNPARAWRSQRQNRINSAHDGVHLHLDSLRSSPSPSQEMRLEAISKHWKSMRKAVAERRRADRMSHEPDPVETAPIISQRSLSPGSDIETHVLLSRVERMEVLMEGVDAKLRTLMGHTVARSVTVEVLESKVDKIAWTIQQMPELVADATRRRSIAL